MMKIRGVRSSIMFVIARANKPVVFTAGGMYNLSITSFASVSITLNINVRRIIHIYENHVRRFGSNLA